MPNRIVVDASALVELLGSPDPTLKQRLRTSSLIAPDIIYLEVMHSLRRRVRESPAETARVDGIVRFLPQAPMVCVDHRPLVGRVWELRHSITVYDAAYVALAEQLGLTLVTCDARLAGSNGHKAKIELYPNR